MPLEKRQNCKLCIPYILSGGWEVFTEKGKQGKMSLEPSTPTPGRWATLPSCKTPLQSSVPGTLCQVLGEQKIFQKVLPLESFCVWLKSEKKNCSVRLNNKVLKDWNPKVSQQKWAPATRWRLAMQLGLWWPLPGQKADKEFQGGLSC